MPPAISISDKPDYSEFERDITSLKTRLDNSRSEKDYRHLRRVEWSGRLSGLLGYGTAWIFPNPLSAFLISQSIFTRWASITHHVMHRGYDKVPGTPKSRTSKTYAKGWRRYVDWLDWIAPEAWDVEHNVLHHYYTGETADPDLVERNVSLVRDMRAPTWIKSIVILFFMATWRWFYYAPNTLYLAQRSRERKNNKTSARGKLRSIMPESMDEDIHSTQLFLPFNKQGIEFWRRCLLPYGFVRFGLIPALFLPLGINAYIAVLVNCLLAELFTNVHSFLMIVPSHAAADLYRFETPVDSRGEFYVRQIIGTANYRTGGLANDMLHGWLNYQIEHHVWPDLSMAQYARAQSELKAICERHGIPYVQENVFKRFGKLWKIMIGKESMMTGDGFSAHKLCNS